MEPFLIQSFNRQCLHPRTPPRDWAARFLNYFCEPKVRYSPTDPAFCSISFGSKINGDPTVLNLEAIFSVPVLKTLFLRAQNPAILCDFYTNFLGMSRFDSACVGYNRNETNLCFLPAKAPYAPNPNDLYWKIAIAVPNIELACRQLAEKGVAIQSPKQFQDIGYLAHFKDPEGFTIELIEHWFQGNRPPQHWDQQRLGGGPHLNLITLRTAQIKPIQTGCAKLGMKPLAVQPVENYGFTLYFFAFTDESPPSKDLTALVNREWLYQRPYSVLEVQHIHRLATVLPPTPGRAGYDHLLVTGTNPNLAVKQLRLRTPTK